MSLVCPRFLRQRSPARWPGGARQQNRVADDDHRPSSSLKARLSSAASTGVVPGHTPWAERKSSVSQRESCPSNRRTCRVVKAPPRYPSTAIASKAVRVNDPPDPPKLSATSSGISNVSCMAGPYHPRNSQATAFSGGSFVPGRPRPGKPAQLSFPLQPTVLRSPP